MSVDPTPELEAHLRTLEESHLDPAFRADPAKLAALLHEDYTEVGASGRVHTRGDVLAALPSETPASRTMHDFRVQLLSDRSALTTYTVVQAEPGARARRSHRASVWVRDHDGWKMLYHQGTTVPG